MSITLPTSLVHDHTFVGRHHTLLVRLVDNPSLQLEASDLAGAQQMLTSSFTLAKGMGDLNGQVASLTSLQQVSRLGAWCTQRGQQVRSVGSVHSTGSMHGLHLACATSKYVGQLKMPLCSSHGTKAYPCWLESLHAVGMPP